MVNEVKTWLTDIHQAIQEINLFLPDKKNFFEFQKDLKTRRAIERNLEIIGEAVGRILKVQPDLQITNARKIVDTRNRISHGYDSVSEEIIWAIVVRVFLNLKQRLFDCSETGRSREQESISDSRPVLGAALYTKSLPRDPEQALQA